MRGSPLPFRFASLPFAAAPFKLMLSTRLLVLPVRWDRRDVGTVRIAADGTRLPMSQRRRVARAGNQIC